jgi:hypothetical protein
MTCKGKNGPNIAFVELNVCAECFRPNPSNELIVMTEWRAYCESTDHVVGDAGELIEQMQSMARRAGSY